VKLTRGRKQIALIFFAVLAALAGQPVLAQKKKKTEPTAITTRQRESEFYFTEGEKYFILEDYSKALIYYQRAIESFPENATAFYKVADILSRSQKQEDVVRASASIENAIKLDPSNKYFYLLGANIYSALTRFDRAADLYEDMFEKIKGTEDYLFELAAVYQFAGKKDKAIETYNRAEEVFGVNETSSIQKIRLYLELSKNKEAITEGEKLTKAFPGEERYAMAFAEVLSGKDQQAQALLFLEQFVSNNPDAVNAKMLLAGFYRDVRDEAKARPILLELFSNPEVEISGKMVVLSTYAAELNDLRLKGQQDKDKETFALQLLDQLLAMGEQNESMMMLAGDLYMASGRTADARLAYSQSVASGAAGYEVWQNLMLLDIQLEAWDDALAHGEKAVELFPNQPLIYYFTAVAQNKKKQFDEAVFNLNEAKKRASGKNQLLSEIHAQLGEAYHAMKEYANSDKAFDEALRLNPADNNILNNYSFYLALRREHLDKAERMCEQLVKNNPDNASYLDTYAWVLYQQKKYKDARRTLEKVISSGKANAVHLEHFGDILFQLGDVDDAVAHWEKARAKNPNREILNKKIANRKLYE